MAGVFTPYSTASEWFGQKPSWVPWELDQQRIMSYQTYEEIYWNQPDTFKVSLRGSNALPIYVPSGRTIIDATHRHTATGFRVTALDEVSGKPSTSSVAAQLAITNLMRRERFLSKFNGNKRYGLIRGDSLWHLTGDINKAPGSRITLTAIDPAMYFPIPDEEDVEKIVGVHLVETFETTDGPRIKRLTYRRGEPNADGLTPITWEAGIFALDKWSGPMDRPETVIQSPTLLPPDITSLPVYHIRNFDEPGNPFGSSDLRGLERLMSAINQTMSDEDLALALAGIGVYATDGSEPVDPRTKQPVPWRISPGSVVHTDGSFWNRVQGVSGLDGSYGAHYNRLWEALKQTSGASDIAIGRVDPAVVASGVALRLELGPMLAKAGEKNDLLIDVQNQMWYDIVRMWMPSYESTSFDTVMPTCTVGDPIPVDRAARFAELSEMLTLGVIDTEYYRTEAAKLGYTFPEGIAATAKAEYDARNVDQFAARVNEDVSDDQPAA